MSWVEFFPWSATSSISLNYYSRDWMWSNWSLIFESFSSSSALTASLNASSTLIKPFVRLLLLQGLRMWTPRPLVAKNHQFRSKITHFLMMLLTADIGGLMECGGNWWVKLDYKILFESHLIIALLDLLRDPSSEGITQEGVDHIDYELSRQFMPITLVWEMLANSFALQSFLEDWIDCETLILRNMEIFGVLRFDD